MYSPANSSIELDLDVPRCLGLRVWGSGFRVWGLGFGFQGLGMRPQTKFRGWGLRIGVEGLGFGCKQSLRVPLGSM